MDFWKLPSLSALRAFEAAARHQSYSKAAQELNVTHAAISQHVRKLEAEFAQTLVVREGRGIALTSMGQSLADSLQSGFAIVAEGVDRLRADTENRALNVSVTPAFAANWLMPRLGDFWSRHPKINININPSVAPVDLRKDGFDLAIRYGEGHWQGVEAELLTDGQFWIVAHPDLIKDRTIRCVEDVADLPWFLESHLLERRVLVDGAGVDFIS